MLASTKANHLIQIMKISKDRRPEQTQDEASKVQPEKKTVTEKTQKAGKTREDPTREVRET